MITTDFMPGAPCWIDLGAPDVAAATTFYRAVFGWEFESFDAEADQYGLLRSNGKTVAGIGPLTEEGARSAWMVYFNTADADAAARATQQAGGTVRLEPFDADGQARMAQLTDPLGAQFAVWQPRNTPGLEAVDEPGALIWTELYTTDAAAAKEFYGSLLGWTTQDMSMPGGGGTYSIIAPAGGGEDRTQGGIMEMGAEFMPDGRPWWHPVFATTDCDATVARVTDHGGSVQMGPEDAEGVGRLAVCFDRAGADFVVLTPRPS
ncbi:hypothetical protein DFQ14_11583 [Halopolyspora algeriensis]|uniref:VOC domain-containing protein n=1 Tax=Halopolyspora algeriensis TaxID=1500506 RepID=A0A368VEL7_9ACTN|nr:VOC family protein [Halopolyspora algeriensis]RCW39707.1 hypothetical protein DFQ14_11583 [Halopolyspora algeriensis]TQM54000.1 hypothetical protein FHU43_2178 [Halopolyspora algeriensis]